MVTNEKQQPSKRDEGFVVKKGAAVGSGAGPTVAPPPAIRTRADLERKTAESPKPAPNQTTANQ